MAKLIGPNHKNDGPLQGLINLLEKHERRLDEADNKIMHLEEEVRLLKEGRE